MITTGQAGEAAGEELREVPGLRRAALRAWRRRSSHGAYWDVRCGYVARAGAPHRFMAVELRRLVKTYLLSA